jgi:hypothetical protein
MATGSSASRPSGRSTTNSSSLGHEVGLSDPLDRDYVCEKICSCSEKTEILDKLGRQLKQRCVTKRIQLDEEELGRLTWRYKAEVGFYMVDPPVPLMSKNQPNRPSRFPIGRAISDGLLLRDLEGRLQKGMLRIPDLTILKIKGAEIAAMRSSGVVDWTRFIPVRRNIDKIAEIKFPGDTLSDGQKRDYPQIAGRDNFIILKSGDCSCDQEERRKRRQPTSAPERSPVVTPILSPPSGGGTFPFIGPAPVPAPQPLPPSYGPVARASDGVSLSEYLKSGGRIAGGLVLVAGAVAIGYMTAGLAAPISGEGIAAGVVLIVTGVAAGAATRRSSGKDTDS